MITLQPRLTAGADNLCSVPFHCNNHPQVDNPVRGALYHLMTTQAVDYFLMLLVLLSCVEVRGWAGAATGR